MARILVVDDDPLNRELLQAMLETQGHIIVCAASGMEAVALATAAPPDLVLLDVMMPGGISGFETARQLRTLPQPTFLPIVLVTALNDRDSRLLGLAAGADEFLTKPIDGQELRLRVRNLLALRAQEAALMQKNQELAELHRFKEEMTSMIVHDLKNPMAAALTNLEYILEDCATMDPSQLEALQDVQTASRRAVRLVHNLLDVASLESGHIEMRRQEVSVANLLGDIIRPRVISARSRNVELRSSIEPELAFEVDSDVMTRVLENLVDNSLRHAPALGAIEISARALGGELQIQVGNSGKAVAVADREAMFQKPTPVSQGGGRSPLALGLYFCRLAVEAHGGRIWITETRELPTMFTIALPRVAA